MIVVSNLYFPYASVVAEKVVDPEFTTIGVNAPVCVIHSDEPVFHFESTPVADV